MTNMYHPIFYDFYVLGIDNIQYPRLLAGP